MGFRLRPKIRQYFENLYSKTGTRVFDTVWDQYYLCLMAGFLDTRISSEEPAQKHQFLPRFSKEYETSKYQIIASLINAEIKRKGFDLDAISPEGNKPVKKLMLSLLDHSSSTSLSDEGIRMLNLYADAGFEVIDEKIGPQDNLTSFIQQYHKHFCC